MSGRSAGDSRAVRLGLSAGDLVVVLVILGLAGVQAARSASTMNPDGVSYLDLSDRLLAGDWMHFAQGYWSPALPALLSFARLVFGTDARREFGIAHGVMFCGALLACVAWLILLRECDATLRARSEPHADLFRSRWVRTAAHAGFAWGVLWLSPPEVVTPDLFLVAAMLFAASLLLRAARTGAGAFALGAVVGAAYLVKFIALPLEGAFLALLLVARRPLEWRGAARAALGFLIVAGPWIAALSARGGRLTAGDAGRLNYGWYVGGIGSQTPRAQPLPGGARWTRVADRPAIFTFGPEAFGTYPAWTDPARWSTQQRALFDPSLQLSAFTREARHAIETLFPLLVTLGLLALVPVGTRDASGALWPLGAIGALGICAYTLVHVEGRLLVPFVPLVICALLGRIAALATRSPRYRAASIAACTVFAAILVVPIVGAEVLQVTTGRAIADLVPISTATVETAAAAGAPPGTAVAVVGPVFEGVALARRARFAVVAEIPPESVSEYWNASMAHRDCALNAFHRAGARAVLAVSYLPESLGGAWTRVLPRVAVMGLPVAPQCTERLQE